MDLDFRMHAERTPNPNSIKWVLGQAVVGTDPSSQFDGEVADDVSPLASALLSVTGVTSVFLGPNFVTVTREPDHEWTELAESIVGHIKDWARSGSPALGPGFERPIAADDDEVVARIRDILERDIRPYVAQDGGEVVFIGYNEGVVEVQLQGAGADALHLPHQGRCTP